MLKNMLHKIYMVFPAVLVSASGAAAAADIPTGTYDSQGVVTASSRSVGVAVALGLTLLWPAARQLVGFGPLHADDLSVTAGAGIAVWAVLEVVKRLWRKRLWS